jgi:hypothetical protein
MRNTIKAAIVAFGALGALSVMSASAQPYGDDGYYGDEGYAGDEAYDGADAYSGADTGLLRRVWLSRRLLRHALL